MLGKEKSCPPMSIKSRYSLEAYRMYPTIYLLYIHIYTYIHTYTIYVFIPLPRETKDHFAFAFFSVNRIFLQDLNPEF